VLPLLCGVLLLGPSACHAGSIPESHSAVLLAKCLPYNEAWSGRTSIRILVLASGVNGKLGKATEIADLIEDVGYKLQEQDSDKPRLEVSASTLRRFEVSDLSESPPHLIFLAEGLGPDCTPISSKLERLAGEAGRLGILVFTDSRAAFEAAAGIYFSLGSDGRPEISGDVERARGQGGQLQGTFLRLLKKREHP